MAASGAIRLPKPDWQSDRAMLYCADARELLPQLPAQSAAMVFTDPPYGHNNNNHDLIARWEAALGKGKPGPPRPIANDGAEANDLFRDCLPLLHRLLKSCSCCCCCCCCGGGPDPQFARWALWLDEVFSFKQMVVWDKGPMGMGWHYRRSYETVLVAQKGKGKCAWYDRTNRVENVIRPGQGIRKIIPRASDHPTTKPPELAAHFIRLHTWTNQWVLDPFMGHGSTGVAALSLGRKFIGIELHPDHFHAARKRLEATQCSKAA